MTTLGRKIAAARRAKRLTQKELAKQIGIGLNTMISIEQGNPSVQFGSYVMALWAVGLSEGFGMVSGTTDGNIPVNPIPGRMLPIGKSESLGLSFPYDWSNPSMGDQAIIDKVVERGVFEDLVKIAAHYGISSLRSSVNAFIAHTPLAAPGLSRMLGNIEKVMSRA